MGESQQHFEGGVKLGMGAFNLVSRGSPTRVHPHLANVTLRPSSTTDVPELMGRVLARIPRSFSPRLVGIVASPMVVR